MVIGVAASSWPVTATLSGASAERENMREVATEQVKVEAASYAQAKTECGMIPVTQEAALVWRAMAQAEAGGGASGSRGNGPIASTLFTVAKGFDDQAEKMVGLCAILETRHKLAGEVSLAQKDAVTKNPEEFARLAGQMSDIVNDHNSFHLTQLVANGGILNISGISNKAVEQKITTAIDPVTIKVRNRVREIESGRRVIPTVDYARWSRGLRFWPSRASPRLEGGFEPWRSISPQASGSCCCC